MFRSKQGASILIVIWLLSWKPVFGQFSTVEIGPPGGPYTTIAHLNGSGQWVVDVPETDIPKGVTRTLKITTPFDNFNLNLTGYDWLDEIYSRGSSTLGGCGPELPRCGFMTISCGLTSKVLVGSTNSGEQSDAMCVCTENGHNSACQSIGRFNCVNDDVSFLVPGVPNDYLATWGDEFAFPAGAVAQSQEVTLSAPRPMPFPEAVPSGRLPITEAVTLAPTSFTLLQPATITIHYSDTEVAGGDEETLTVFRFDQNSMTWITQPSVLLNTDANTLTFQTLQFGSFGFSALPDPQAFPALPKWGGIVLVILLFVAAPIGLGNRHKQSAT